MPAADLVLKNANVITMAVVETGLEKRRSIAIADPQIIKIRYQNLGIPEGEPLIKLKAVRTPGDPNLSQKFLNPFRKGGWHLGIDLFHLLLHPKEIRQCSFSPKAVIWLTQAWALSSLLSAFLRNSG